MNGVIILDKNYSTTRCVINEETFQNENNKSESKLKKILFLPSKKKELTKEG